MFTCTVQHPRVLLFCPQPPSSSTLPPSGLLQVGLKREKWLATMYIPGHLQYTSQIHLSNFKGLKNIQNEYLQIAWLAWLI